MPKASVNLKETDRRTLINGCVGKKEAWFPARAADASVRFCLAGLPWLAMGLSCDQSTDEDHTE